jgi:hypothetical protein
VFEPGSTSRRVAIYAVAGAFIGTAWGSWSLASRGADRTAVSTQAQAPEAPACPDGYARAPGFDRGAIVDGTRDTRWLVRCDPVRSESAVSESLDLFWAPEVIPDPRARPDALRSFVDTIAQANHVALEPLPSTERATLVPATAQRPAVEGLALDARGGFRLPGFVARAWAVPARTRTLLVLLVAPSGRATEVEARAADAVSRVEGVHAYEGTSPAERGFAVTARCPAHWSDTTPADGGPAPALYVGRACIEPTQGGGAELTFAEVTGRMDGEGGASRLFELAAAMINAVGPRVSNATVDRDAGASAIAQGFGRTEPATVAGVEGRTARAEIEPPAARLALRAWMAPAGGGSVLALGTSLLERREPTRAALDRWLQGSPVLRPYDAPTLQGNRSRRFRLNVLIPGLITAVLGALVAVGRSRSLAKGE